MANKNFKICIYIVIAVLIIIFYTKDLNLFGKGYNNVKVIDNPDILLVLVNKNFKLPDDYVPTDLETINTDYAFENKSLRKDAKDSFEQLSKDAKNLGYSIIAISTYRNYEYQTKLFDDYAKNKGQAYALECSARAGHSEHQTGLAVDVMGSNSEYEEFANSKEFGWMINNSYKYGFILRYPKDKVKITGFKYEPWHYRYVGKQIAAIMYEENLVLEEYYDKYINLN